MTEKEIFNYLSNNSSKTLEIISSWSGFNFNSPDVYTIGKDEIYIRHAIKTKTHKIRIVNVLTDNGYKFRVAYFENIKIIKRCNILELLPNIRKLKINSLNE